MPRQTAQPALAAQSPKAAMPAIETPPATIANPTIIHQTNNITPGHYVDFPALGVSIVSLIVAGIALWIANRDRRTREDRLKVAIYAQRLSAYERVHAFLEAIRDTSGNDPDALRHFEHTRHEIIFLFKKDINDYVNNDLYETACNWRAANNRIDQAKTSPRDIADDLATQQRCERWFIDETKAIDDRFRPYLDLTTII